MSLRLEGLLGLKQVGGALVERSMLCQVSHDDCTAINNQLIKYKPSNEINIHVRVGVVEFLEGEGLSIKEIRENHTHSSGLTQLVSSLNSVYQIKDITMQINMH